MWDLINWFAGGVDASGQWTYMQLSRCMGGDVFWIALTIALDCAVAAGYCLIALHWWRNEKTLPASPAKNALGSMRNIFLLCGACGYAFIPMKMLWPAWRLYDLVMIGLVYVTWKYAWNARDLKVIYSELGRSRQLAADLAKSKQESREKSIFLNSISHDLRTPLNGIVLQTNLARMGAETGNKELLEGAMQEIENSARATGEMLDRLLAYARLNVHEEHNVLSEVSLQQLIQGVMHSLQPVARQKALGLSVSCESGLVIRSDALKVERILQNLVNNALKFTQSGGVKIMAEQDGNAVEIHVIDTGIGIPDQHREHLFEEFFQVGNIARDRTKGFGLGLAIARRLARQLGGDIALESSVGHGSRFSVLLPGCVVEPRRVAIGGNLAPAGETAGAAG